MKKFVEKFIFNIISILMILFLNSFNSAKSQTAVVTDNFTVNGSLVVTSATSDSAAGKNPTLNVNISVTPDLGASNATGSANFRLRTNQTAWRLTASRTALSAGGTGLALTDILLDVSTSAGSNANASAGTRVSPFTSQTTLNSVGTSATNVISGTAKTSSVRDSTNTSNYFQVNTTYSVPQDFFFTPGTASTTITYTLVSP